MTDLLLDGSYPSADVAYVAGGLLIYGVLRRLDEGAWPGWRHWAFALVVAVLINSLLGHY